MDWNYRYAAHLLNRAGFGGTPVDIAKLQSMGAKQAVEYLLDYEHQPEDFPPPAWAHPNSEEERQAQLALKNATPEQRTQLQKETRRRYQQQMLELRYWWLQKMTYGHRPLQEKLVLFWHGHFATSEEKVRHPYYMWRQNELFRRLATGNWGTLLLEAGKDPAMLIWLDQAQSRKDHPNENYAREVMELFSLGEGHYTEQDITEAARALTGWSLDQKNQQFTYRPLIHDNSTKTIFGQTGNFDGDDFIKQILQKPQAAEFLTAKLWTYFAGQPPTPEFNRALAEVLRQHNYELKPLLRTIFTCSAFYSDAVIQNQVKSPVQWLVGSVKVLESQLPPASISCAILRQLGQDIFAPPNVKGWDGGITWISTNSLLERYNDAQTLIDGSFPSLTAADLSAKAGGQGGKALLKTAQRLRMGGVDLNKILSPEDRATTQTIVSSLALRLFQKEMSPPQEGELYTFLHTQKKLDDTAIKTVIRLMMATPDYQIT